MDKFERGVGAYRTLRGTLKYFTVRECTLFQNHLSLVLGEALVWGYISLGRVGGSTCGWRMRRGREGGRAHKGLYWNNSLLGETQVVEGLRVGLD